MGVSVKSKIKNKKEIKTLRSYLRRNMPAPEVLLWEKLRRKSLGTKFRRQFSIDNYILDFYAPTVKLAIEIDGESHFSNKIAIEKDLTRDWGLKEHGIKVLRFTNLEVTSNLDGVCSKILEKLSTPS